MSIAWFLQNYLKNICLVRFDMGTLGTKIYQWHPGHVPYLPHPRYATGHMRVTLSHGPLPSNEEKGAS